jgi:hypothetical protein
LALVDVVIESAFRFFSDWPRSYDDAASRYGLDQRRLGEIIGPHPHLDDPKRPLG